MEEIWKDVPGFEGYYQVSSMGRVKSVDRVKCDGVRMKGRIRKTHLDACGYELVQLRKDGAMKHFSVHRLVALAFIPNPEGLPQVNHIDEVRNHNTVDNLEWCDHVYNNNYGSKAFASRGERNSQCKYSEQTIREVRNSFIPRDPNYGITPLAKKYGMSQAHLCSILKGRIWGWIE